MIVPVINIINYLRLISGFYSLNKKEWFWASWVFFGGLGSRYHLVVCVLTKTESCKNIITLIVVRSKENPK